MASVSQPVTTATAASLAAACGETARAEATGGPARAVETALLKPAAALQPSTSVAAASQPMNFGVAASQPFTFGAAASLPSTFGAAASQPLTFGVAASEPFACGAAASQPWSVLAARSKPFTFGAKNPLDFGMPARDDAVTARASQPTTAAAALSLASAHGDTEAQKVNNAAASAEGNRGVSTPKHNRLRYKLNKEGKIRSAEEVEQERLQAIRKENTRRKTEGLEVSDAQRPFSLLDTTQGGTLSMSA